MRNLLEGTNPYANDYANFKDSKLLKRLENKFRVKPYHEAKRPLKRLALGFSYLLNTFSVVVGFFFVQGFLLEPLGNIAAATIAIITLSALEGFKRLLLPDSFKNYLQFNTIAYLNIIAIVALITLSAYLSAKGADIAIKSNTPPPPSINVDSIRQHHSTILASKQAKQDDLAKIRYKGTTTRTAQKAIAALQIEINEIRQQQSQQAAAAAATNKHAAAAAAKQAGSNGFYFAILALLFDMLLVICIAYSEYYDYRSLAEYAAGSSSADGGGNNGKSGAVNGLKTIGTATVHAAETIAATASTTAKNDRNDQPTKQQTACVHCSTKFPSKARKKFCSDKCRVDNWNEKQPSGGGKLLTVPT